MTPRAVSRRRRGYRRWLEQLGIGCLVLVVWDAAVRVFEIPPFLIPSPVAVAESLWLGFASGVFVSNAAYTLAATMLGFVLGSLIGLVLGVLIASIEVLDRLLYPYIVAFQTVPKVAIAPLVVIWFGFGIWSKVAMSLMICFFPVVVNTIEGLHAADPEQIMLLRSYRASRLEIFRMVQLPNALPFIFAGLDVGIVLSVIGTIVGEFVGSTAGLGYVILEFNHAIDIAGVFASLVVLSALGVALHTILRVLHRRVVFWRKPTTVIGA